MKKLPPAFNALKNYQQFIVYHLLPSIERPGKFDKKPIDHRTGSIASWSDPNNWTDYQTAIDAVQTHGKNYGVGFVLTKEDPFFFIDIDNCLDTKANNWNQIATELCTKFQGAAIEISSSNKGIHILGTGIALPHTCRNSEFNLEFYTENRFVALTGTNVIGSIETNCDHTLPWLIDTYFPCRKEDNNTNTEWTNSPCKEWSGPENDDDLIALALNSKSANAVFGNKASFQDLWEANEEALSNAFPGDSRTYDASRADAALAQHLAFWTGNNCERILKLIRESKLARDKWDREDYSQITILKACSQQTKWFNNKTLKPTPLPSLPDVLPFEYSYLPNAIRGYVQDISERMQCPPDFPAVAVIIMLAAILGRKIGIRPKRKDTWTIIPNLWGAIIGIPGVKKTPVLNATLLPIRKLQGIAIENFNAEKYKYDEQLKLIKIKQSVNKIVVKKQLQKNQTADITQLLKSDEEINPPILKRYLINNSTYEKLGEILSENSNGVLVQYDEIIGLLKQLETQGQEVARSFYLSCASGDTSYTFDRIARGTLHIPAACLSIIGGIQPGVLAEYVKQATNGGAGADGLLQRFSLMVYPDISASCQYIDRYPDKEALNAVNNLVEKLDNLKIANIDAINDEYNDVPYLHFDNEAQELYCEWTIKLDKRLLSNEEHPAIVSHLMKYQKLIPSLALIFHLSDANSNLVNKTALKRAIDFSEYLESHAQRIYSYATRPDIDAAKALLKRLINGKLSTPFKARDVSQKGWAGLETASKTQCAIDLLLEYQHLSEKEVNNTGGRPTKLYHWIKE